jgi:adenylate cyclase
MPRRPRSSRIASTPWRRGDRTPGPCRQDPGRRPDGGVRRTPPAVQARCRCTRCSRHRLRGSERGASSGLRAAAPAGGAGTRRSGGDGGDCFGDAVNVAARLLDHAGDNETLVTVEVLQGLPVDCTIALSQPGPPGAARPRRAGACARAGRPPRRRRPGGHAVRRRLGRVTEPDGLRLSGAACTGCLPASRCRWCWAAARRPLLRRRLARVALARRVDWHSGSFQLTDLSYNGTYVRFNDGEIVSLRRGSCTCTAAAPSAWAARPPTPARPA